MRFKFNFTRGKAAFTLVELLVSMAILTLLLLVLLSITDSTRRTWSYTNSKVEQFRNAREAFESITRKLSQATLNTYWDYDNVTAPTKYLRQSELRFITGNASALTGKSNTSTQAVFFQAPLGYITDTTSYSNLETLLNTWGYFIEFGDDSKLRPPFITQQVAPYRSRFRLVEMMEPSESSSLYKYTNGNPSYKGHEWFTDPLASANASVRVLAENIVSLVLLPKLTPQEDPTGTRLAPNYGYDSTSTNSDPTINPKNQLPPVVQVTMMAVDEASYSRFQSVQPNNNMPESLDLQSLFQKAGDLLDKTKPGYAQDLQSLQEILQENKLNYRVFTSSVSIKAAKWSREQKN